MNLAVRTKAKPSSSPCRVLSSRATQLTQENVWFYFEIRFALAAREGVGGGGGLPYYMDGVAGRTIYLGLGVQPRKVHSGSF